MRIGLDLICLRGERFGMSWVAWWQAAWLPRLAPDDTFVFFLPPGVASPAAERNVEIVRVPMYDRRGGRVLAEQWELPRRAAPARLDVLHTIAYGSPILYRGPRLLTVHDLGFRIYPDTVPPRFRHYWNWAYGPAARGCRHLVAVSEATRRDIVTLLGRPAAQISVVPCGVDPAFMAAGSQDEASGPVPPERRAAIVPATGSLAAELGSAGPYLLNVGAWQPRKDLITLLRAFEILGTENPHLRLLLCGSPGWGYPPMERLIEAHAPRTSGRVVPLPSFPAGELPGLYRGAALFLFTSIHEGFGLPLLEAMAAGVPVVTTDNSAIPEVAGDAALRAPVGDAPALAAQAGRVLTEPALRNRLVSEGHARARVFSWKRSAERLLDVYRAHFGPAENRP